MSAFLHQIDPELIHLAQILGQICIFLPCWDKEVTQSKFFESGDGTFGGKVEFDLEFGMEGAELEVVIVVRPYLGELIKFMQID